MDARTRLLTQARENKESEAKAQLEQRASQIVIPQALFKPNPNGYGLSISSIRPGVAYQVRFLSDILPMRLHFADGRPSACLGRDCERCHDATIYGYADCLTFEYSLETKRHEITRAIKTFTGGMLQTLYLEHGLGAMGEADDAGFRFIMGNSLAGYKVEFHRAKARGKTAIRILESTVNTALPTACNVRAVMMRRYGLTRWPEYDVATVQEECPGILKFQRKQA